MQSPLFFKSDFDGIGVGCQSFTPGKELDLLMYRRKRLSSIRNNTGFFNKIVHTKVKRTGPFRW